MIIGDSIDQSSIDLSEGWNLISGISEEVSIESISDPGTIIVSGTLFAFQDGYLETDVILPGKGYWIRASAPGSITLLSP